MNELDNMSGISTHGTRKRPGSPRPAFLLGLLGSVGIALGALQTIQPLRDAFGLDSVVRPVARTARVAPRPDVVAPPETLSLDRLAWAQRVERPARPIPMRRLGSGTRRALRLAPAAVQLSSAGTPSSPATTVQPVAAAVPPPSRTIQRPDSARRDDAALGAVQYAKLDNALRQLVDGDPAAPVRVIVQTQPGQHDTTAQWLTTEGRAVHQLHPSISGLTATLSASDVAALSEDPSIARLSINAVVHATAEPTSGAVLKDTLGLAEKGGLVGATLNGQSFNGDGN